MQDLKSRTKEFALAIVRLCAPFSSFKAPAEAQVLGKQLLRSGTSVGAHYREGMRAKSDLDFISKLEGALQELEESMYWMEMLSGAGIVSEERIEWLHGEASELIAIFITIVKNRKAAVRRMKDER